MKSVCQSLVLLSSLLLVSLNVNAEVVDGLSDGGFKHPPMDGNVAAPAPAASAASPMLQPEGPVAQGKVVEATTASGYTYLLLESGGQTVWVAATQVSAKVGDVVNYVANVTMDNFTSRSIDKTFDRIIFASSVSVVK